MKNFILLVVIAFLSSCNNSGTSTSATDSTSLTTHTDSSAKMEKSEKINTEYLSYQDEGEIINADSVKVAVDELKALSKAERKARLKSLRQANRDCLKGKIIKKPGTFRFSLKGVDIFVKNQKIVGVGSLDLNQDQLSAITQTLGMLDDLLYQTCLNLNREFSQQSQSDVRIMHLYDIQQSATEKLAQIGTTLQNLDQSNANATKVKSSIDSLNKSVDSATKKIK